MHRNSRHPYPPHPNWLTTSSRLEDSSTGDAKSTAHSAGSNTPIQRLPQGCPKECESGCPIGQHVFISVRKPPTPNQALRHHLSEKPHKTQSQPVKTSSPHASRKTVSRESKICRSTLQYRNKSGAKLTQATAHASSD
jgi:hypothetical protein